MPRTAPNKRKLTARILQKVKPQPHPVMVWDTYQRGLALRVEPTGYKAWKVIYRHGNRPRWFNIGAADAISLSEARRLAAEIMLEVARGNDPQAERKAKRMAGTFAEVADRYLNEHAKRKNKSWEQADYLVRRYLLPAWAKLSAKVITRSDVRTVMGRIKSPTIGNQTLAAASAIFSWAIKQELVTTNPCRGVERNETKSRERVLTDAEIPLFWSAFDDAGLVRSSALKVLLLTGQRPGEVARMRLEHIADGWWTMPGAPTKLGWLGTKNSQTHRVWLPQAARDIIAELSDEETSGFVFSSARRHAIDGLDDAMRAACQRLGVERATLHSRRYPHAAPLARRMVGVEGIALERASRSRGTQSPLRLCGKGILLRRRRRDPVGTYPLQDRRSA